MSATVMIVDDDADVRTVTKMMLERKGYSVHAFGNGPQALKHIEDCIECNIVISDIIMPDMTGVELAIYIKKAKPESKVVLTSAMPIDNKDWRTIVPLQTNVDDFIAKPFSIDEIADIIQKYTKEQTKRSEF